MGTKKKYLLLTAVVIALVFVAVLFNLKETKQTGVHAEIIEVSEGYGYQILFKEKVLINQEVIPAIQGEIPFKSKEEAKLVAEKVVKKIDNGEDPFITITELNDLNITTVD